MKDKIELINQLILKRSDPKPKENLFVTATDAQRQEAEELESVLLVNEDLANCMREGCEERRCIVPVQGESVLCRFHTEEVFRGEAKAPPIRRGFDYQAVGRKTFLVDDLSFLDPEKK